MIKLNLISLYKSFVNNFFVIGFGFLLLLISITSIYLSVFFLGYLIYLYKKNKAFSYILAITSLIFLLSFYISKKGFENNKITKGYIIDIQKEEDYQKITITNYFWKAIVYDNQNNNLMIADYIEVEGVKNEITENRVPNGFDSLKYYFSIKVNNVINSTNIEKENRINIYLIKRLVYNYLDYFFDGLSNSYLKALVLGDTSLIEKDIKLDFSINGITHLFAISGLHINILITFLYKILKTFNTKEKTNDNIIITFLSFYIIITSFSVSILRACLMHIIIIMSKRYNLFLNKQDILTILFIFLLIINPNYLYNLSFKLSFMATFLILLTNSLLNTFLKNFNYSKVLNQILITLAIQLFLFPLAINISNSFNILNIITNVVFIFLVSNIIIPFSYLVFVLPIFSFLYTYLITSFNYLNSIFSKYFSLNLIIPTFSFYGIIIFYFLIFMFFTFYKHKIKYYISFIFCLFLVIHYNKINLNINGEIVFLDLYQGDSIVINLPLNEGVIIIDTGTGKNDALTKYLKSIGVRKIDCLILTHNDFDHNGEAEKLLENFDVTKIYISAYDDNVFLRDKNVIRVKKNDNIKIGSIEFLVCSPEKNLNDTNSNSLILYTTFGNLNYLFLGDASSEIEESLIPYNLDVDIVKVGHHGSKTSTSPSFYNSINPSYVIIQTGQVKRYGFPHKEVLEVLKYYQVLRTDLNYSITIKYSKKKSIISTIR